MPANKVQPAIPIAGPRDMVAKAKWELRLITDHQEDERAVAFSILNAALSAWQTAEWVWPKVPAAEADRIKTQFVKYVPRPKEGLDGFKRWAQKQEKAIESCRLVGTTLKHTEVILFVNSPNLKEVAVSAASAVVGRLAGEQGGLILTEDNRPIAVEARVWIPKFVIDGSRVEAIPVVQAAIGFWENFLNANKIDPI